MRKFSEMFGFGARTSEPTMSKDEIQSGPLLSREELISEISRLESAIDLAKSGEVTYNSGQLEQMKKDLEKRNEELKKRGEVVV
ncbi:MAG: hypothetical protein ABIH21_02225 [Patescibacteria group bacterium]